VRDARGLGAGLDVELCEDARDVNTGGLRAHEQRLADLGVRATFGDEAQHVQLARGQGCNLVRYVLSDDAYASLPRDGLDRV
jgi:hypothetical protein